MMNFGHPYLRLLVITDCPSGYYRSIIETIVEEEESHKNGKQIFR